MRAWTAIRASAARELAAVAARPWEIFAAAVAPLLWMGITWGLLGNGMQTALPVALVDDDRTGASREIARVIAAAQSPALEPYASLAEAEQALRSNEVFAVLHVPSGYGREQSRGGGLPVVLFLNEQYFAAAGDLEGDVRSAVAEASGARAVRMAALAGGGFEGGRTRVEILRPDFVVLGNPGMSYQAYLGSALLPGMLQLFAVMAFLGAIARETRERTVGAWLSVAGGRFWPALAGKLAPFVGFYLLLAAGYVAWVAGWNGWAPSGSLATWIAGAFLLVLAMLGFAILFSAVAPDWRLALTLGSLFVAPTLPFTGFSLPQASMGAAARIYGYTVPLTWYLKVQSEQWTLASSFADSLPALAILAGFALVPWLLAGPLLARRMRRAAGAA